MANTGSAVGTRQIKVGIQSREYGDNRIRTARYSLLSFVPLCLFAQLSRFSNLYFIGLAALQLIKSISLTDQVPSILFPLSGVISIVLVKDAIEDYKRHLSDNKENSQQTLVLSGGEFVARAWRDLRAGDVVKVAKEEFVPADLILLFACQGKAECFVETASIDGESSLKLKLAVALAKGFGEDQLSELLDAKVDFEAPNPYLYEFSGSLNIRNTQVAVDAHNLLLRNSKLKNTEYIVGVVAFNGHYTKIMMNSVKSKRKLSEIESKISYYMLLTFLIKVLDRDPQLVLCAAMAALYVGWLDANRKFNPYLQLEDRSLVTEFFIKLGSWLLIMS